VTTGLRCPPLIPPATSVERSGASISEAHRADRSRLIRLDKGFSERGLRRTDSDHDPDSPANVDREVVSLRESRKNDLAVDCEGGVSVSMGEHEEDDGSDVPPLPKQIILRGMHHQ
jgi:hypothetical protein